MAQPRLINATAAKEWRGGGRCAWYEHNFEPRGGIINSASTITAEQLAEIVLLGVGEAILPEEETVIFAPMIDTYNWPFLQGDDIMLVVDPNEEAEASRYLHDIGDAFLCVWQFGQMPPTGIDYVLRRADE